MEMIQIPKEEYLRMKAQIAKLQEIENEEIELTDWAKNELEEARKRKSKIPHEKVREMIFGK